MSAMASSLHRIGQIVARARERLEFVPPLLTRITLGVLFMGTGWGKVHNLDKVISFFAELGIPAPAVQATAISWLELVGGALLLLGIGARTAAGLLAATMAVALLTAKASDIHGLSDLFGTIEFTYFVLLVWIALGGPGTIALDRLLPSRRGESLVPADPMTSTGRVDGRGTP